MIQKKRRKYIKIKKIFLLGGVEPPSRDSKSHMITATPQENSVLQVIKKHLFNYIRVYKILKFYFNSLFYEKFTKGSLCQKNY